MKSPKKPYKKYDYDQLSPVEVFQLVLAGKIKKFPNRTWDQPDSVAYGAEIVRYWVEKVMQWSDEDIKMLLSARIFYRYKLGGLISVFNGSPYQAINAAYPGRFKEWELKIAPFRFWTRENGIKAVKWLIEEKLNWSDEEIKKNLSHAIFSENHLNAMLICCFGGCLYQAINAAYPGRFKERDLSRAPINYWNYENAVTAIKWLIEEKFQWNEEDIKKNFSGQILTQNRLGGPFQKFFNGRTFQALEAIYPGRFKEWELPIAPKGFWTEENAIKAVKWLIEEKLQWSDDDIKRQISVKTFRDNGLDGLINNCFKSSPFKAIDAAYPGRFKEWELPRVPKNFWTEDTAAKAIRWLIEEKLKWSDGEIKSKFSYVVLEKHGFGPLYGKLFNYNAFKALDNAYPGRFKRQDLLHVK